MTKVLVIAPHMDDEVLGCAGAILRHVKEKDEVSVCFVACRIYNHAYNREKNAVQRRHAQRAKEVLRYQGQVFFELPDERLDVSLQDIIVLLEKYVQQIKPEVVYLPFRGDNNQDHRSVFDAARVIFRPAASRFVKGIYMYEVPSSTDQSPPLVESAFMPNYYINITKFIDKKIKAFRCYQTEKRDYPHPRSEQALRVLAQKRGTEIGFEYSEAFMMLRNKWG